ncbi:hypothetical protein LCGC14_1520720 [marine sediment metagenome]|uniref:Leucine-rich repeat domain-containing protein n=1 Tax=marine sediment metagenome TaxID=412755 RepID=A0A0F9LZT3_9ZZZZ
MLHLVFSFLEFLYTYGLIYLEFLLHLFYLFLSEEDLKFLEVLNLTDNNFKFIPKPVYELRSLKELYVQSNKFVPNTKSIKEKMGNKDIKIIS